MAQVLAAKESVDVVVVGCGAGGGVIAKELGEAGVEVVVLEAGRRFDPNEDFPTDRVDFELTAMNVFAADDPRRDRYTSGGEVEFFCNRVKGVGGSTLHYVAISPRLHESDFRAYERDGVAADWPITYADLEPYYSRVEQELGVSGPGGDEANPFEPPRSRPFPTPPHPFNAASLVVKRGTDALGLRLVREPVAIPTRDWNGRPACVNAGTCQLGCKIAAKSSIDVTYVPKAEATGRVRIRPSCMARRIRVRDDGRVSGVVYFDAEGREREISARAVVVAGNAIETPRLLLMSATSAYPDGLANSSGMVGRHFTEHLAAFGTGVFAERLDAWRGIPSGGMLQDFYETDARAGHARGFTIVVSNNQQWPLSVARQVPGWGATHKARVLELFGHTVTLASIGEQLPDPRNRITLDPEVTDNYGLPVPRITNNLHENDRAMLRAISRRIEEILQAAGAREVRLHRPVPGDSSHYMGSCRMGHDPSTSVVDARGRTHDHPNLFIGDGSVFATVGAVNPALTISALATRTAEGILESFRGGAL